MTALLLSTLLALSLCGCANWDEETYGNDPLSELSEYYQPDVQEEAPALTDFVLPYLSGETWNPITCNDGVQTTLTALLYEPLYRLTPQLEPERVLAQSESYDAERFTYTIRLRSGLTFSDGTALTARDVVDTLLQARQSTRYGARLADMVSVTAPGSDTVVIELSRDRQGFTALLDIPIVKSGTGDNTVPIGTGPYYKEGEALLPNPYWWSSDALPFDTIGLLGCKSEEAAAYAFPSHDVHLLSCDLTAPNASIASTSGSYTDADTTILHFLGFNMSRRLLQDADMRRAISMAVDRSVIVSAYLLGHGAVTQFPVHPSSPLYPHVLEVASTANDCLAAMEALNMADGEDVYDLVLLVNSENSCKVSAAEDIARSLEEYDFRVTVRALPWEEYLTALSEGRYDLYYGECKLTADWDLTALLSSGGSLNYGGGWDTILDIQIDDFLSAEGQDARTEAMEVLCRRLQAQMPIVPICFESSSVLLPNDAVDVITPTATNPFYDLDRWVVNWDKNDE